MKKIFCLLVLIAIQQLAFAQKDSTRIKLRPYVSLGVSIGHVDPSNSGIDNFHKASYPSFEAGVMGENVSLGAVVGCENFFVTSDSKNFYELKTAISKPVGKCSAYALFGVGAYFEDTFNPFIEYGGGFSYMPNKLGYFVQYSNWSRTNYISLGLSFGF